MTRNLCYFFGVKLFDTVLMRNNTDRTARIYVGKHASNLTPFVTVSSNHATVL